MSDLDSLLDVLGLQAGACRAMGSPFSAGLLERAKDAAPQEPELQDLFQPWIGKSRQEIFTDAAALRWLGALHDAVLAAPASPLARAYPADGNPGDPAAAWPLALRYLQSQTDRAAAFMRHEPQTNEVRRSAVLLPGFLAISALAPLPLRLLELGASAGLNQLWDQRRYHLGPELAWGPEDAPFSIDAEWRGDAPPLHSSVVVASRSACDRSPIDLTDPLQRRRLRAYIWPDQFDRLARLDAAVIQSLHHGVSVDREDAVVWARRNAAPAPGMVTVVFHSVFFQYMPPESQTALTQVMLEFGERASEVAPLAWLRMEPGPDNSAIMELRLTLWPFGEDKALARAHPHGAWIEWFG